MRIAEFYLTFWSYGFNAIFILSLLYFYKLLMGVLFIYMNIQICTIKNIVIKFSVHDASLEQPSSGTLKAERLESQTI